MSPECSQTRANPRLARACPPNAHFSERFASIDLALAKVDRVIGRHCRDALKMCGDLRAAVQRPIARRGVEDKAIGGVLQLLRQLPVVALDTADQWHDGALGGEGKVESTSPVGPSGIPKGLNCIGISPSAARRPWGIPEEGRRVTRPARRRAGRGHDTPAPRPNRPVRMRAQ